MKPRATKRVWVQRVREGGLGSAQEDWLAVEEPLEIRVQGDTVAVTMRTPGNDDRLALGFLFSEGIVRALEDVSAVAHCGRPDEEGFGNVIEVTPAPGTQLELERIAAS